MSLRDKIMNLEPIDLFDYKDEIEILNLMSQCEQNPKWHSEGDVLTHTNMVMAEALKLCKDIPRKPDKINVYTGAMLHDLGKPSTTFRKNSNVVAYGHESAGLTYARQFLKEHFPSDFNFLRREYILSFVEFHGHPKRMIESDSKDSKFYQLSLDANTCQLYNICLSDFLGRTGEHTSDESVALMTKFKEKCESLNIWDRPYIIPNSKDFSNALYSLVRWEILFHQMNLDTDAGKRRLAHLAKLSEQKPFELMITVGAPGSGKTTHIEKVYPHVERISMDDERKKVCGDINDMSQNQLVFENCFGYLRDNMQKRINTIWDATSLTRKSRRRLIETARRQGARISFVHFDLPYDEVTKRNQERDRTVPEDVVNKFYHNIQPPKSYEYDRILVVDETVKLENKDESKTQSLR